MKSVKEQVRNHLRHRHNAALNVDLDVDVRDQFSIEVSQQIQVQVWEAVARPIYQQMGAEW